MIRLVHVTTLPQTAASFLHGQLRWMGQNGIDVTLVSSPGPQLAEFAESQGAGYRSVLMQRAISPLADAKSVWQLTAKLREIRPHIVHAHTPKAGLVGMIAATLAGVPVRIYQLHGLRFESANGWQRRVLKGADAWTCRLAHRVICVSSSLMKKGADEGLFDPPQATVLLGGSANGLDVDQFAGSQHDQHELRRRTRQRLGIPASAMCLGFVGRLVRDKGVLELHSAWQRLRQQFPELHLLIVGPYESHDSISLEVQRQLAEDPRVHLTGLDWKTRGYYAAMDVFTLPTHREGLGHVLLEAGSMALPVVSCQVTGCVDAVLPGETGELVPARDSTELAIAIARYLNSPELRRQHGQAGREWVRSQFAPQPIWHAILDEYDRLLRVRCPCDYSGFGNARKSETVSGRPVGSSWVFQGEKKLRRAVRASRRTA